jgi:hypothetical protein
MTMMMMTQEESKNKGRRRRLGAERGKRRERVFGACMPLLLLLEGRV